MPKKKNYSEPVLMNMTGDEFKRLIEQRDINGVVDTLNEVMAMFEGIGDDETIAEYVRRVAVTADNMPENSIGTAQIQNEAVHLEDLNAEVRDQLIGDGITEEDLEEIFFPTTDNEQKNER